MKKCVFLLALALLWHSSPVAGVTRQYANGLWFDGGAFQKRTFYSRNGILAEARPDSVDEVIDLDGGFVVPPYGEAHNHNISRPARAEELARYVGAGVLYVMIQNNMLPRPGQTGTDLASMGVDVAYANGGLTPSGGHVVKLHERLVDLGVIKHLSKQQLDGQCFFVIDDLADLARKWNEVLEGRPDFLKIFMGFSEEYGKRLGRPEYFGKRGLDPDLVGPIVEKAHEAGLRVSAHIETAADFHQAVAAGVDIVAHLPGWRVGPEAGFQEFSPARYLISREDARRAAELEITTLTTALAGDAIKKPDSPYHDPVREIYVRNLKTLTDQGAPLALGSDHYGGTSVSEALLLGKLGVFDNLTLLKMLSDTTPRTIFPARKIGKLRDGYEASFLVLERSPLEDLSNLSRIRMRIKKGERLDEAGDRSP